MPPLTSLEFCGSAGLQKELQGVIAYVAWEMICTEFESMNVNQQYEKMRILYHGDHASNVYSLAKQFVEGEGLFRGLYDEETVEVTDPNYRGSSRELLLKKVFHCGGQRVHVGGSHGIRTQLISAC
jgi:hypothetical protein